MITGASRGIGRAIALSLAKEGRNLILIADKDRTGLNETVALVKRTYLENFGSSPASYMHCRSFLCDVSDSDMVEYLFEQLEKEKCRIDVLVNNAGISHFQLVQDMRDSDWHHVLAVNLNSVFYMSRAVIPDMIRSGGGSIINISSFWGICGSSMESAYCASKGGVNAFTLSLAKELAPSNIRVNALACEFLNTSMNEGFTEEEISDILKVMPSHRIIEPEEIGRLVAELAAPESTLTGQILGMD